MTSLPDTRLALINWLVAHPDLPGTVSVGGERPDDLAAQLPFVALFEPPGGVSVAHRIAMTLINVQAWAATAKAARDTCHTARDLIHAAAGLTTAGVVIQNVTDQSLPGEQNDLMLPDAYLWLCTVAVQARNS